MLYRSALLLCLLLIVRCATAQPIPFDSARWEIEAQEHRLETFAGKPALYVQNGAALLRDTSFEDGIITFEIAFPPDRAFTGAVWRLQDEANFEHFYFRPHQSGNPDANQYTPVFNGVSGWQLYAGAGYGAPTPYVFNEWMPVRIVVSGGAAEVYIRDMETPALFIPELKREGRAGRVGVQASGTAGIYFANFSVTPQAGPALKGRTPERTPAPPGSVTAWQVSNTFREADLEAPLLTAPTRRALTWTPLQAEATGIANLARVQGIDDERNTAFARVVVTSDRAQVKALRFGFSDRVRVYLNDRLLYAGTDNYQSRDYRFLGTIGAFDVLYLPLKAGLNELWFAVSEDFGGWGLLAYFEDPAGLRIHKP